MYLDMPSIMTLLTYSCRHRKPATDDDGNPTSPRKPLSAVHEDSTNFGTIF